MRPIKFRAWDGKKMVYGVLAGGNTECPNVCEYDMDAVWWWHEPPIAIMQFTGLLDRDGKEIYEGDLLLIDSELVNFVTGIKTGKRCQYIKEVLWSEKHWGWAYRIVKNIENYPGTLGHISGGYINFGNPIVIGNIYQNPELLEEK